MHKVRRWRPVWHRMGDVGYLDDRDRFWFCGRKAHRVTTDKRTLFTVPCEAIFNATPGGLSVGSRPTWPAAESKRR